MSAPPSEGKAAAPAPASASSRPPSASAAQHLGGGRGRGRGRGGGRGGRSRSWNPERAGGGAGGHQQQHQHHHGYSHHGHSHSHGGGHYRREQKSEEMLEAEHYIDVVQHIQRYATHTLHKIAKVDSDFRRLQPKYRALVPTFDAKMRRIRECIATNQQFVRKIVEERRAFFQPGIDYDALFAREGPVNEERMSKIRSTLRQCYRDWSMEGAVEREMCYGPIIKELKARFPTVESRAGVKVCCPGSGLGRLVWDLAHLGFTAQGNEFSYFMLLTSYVILNCLDRPGQFTLYPFVDDCKNVLRTDDQFLPIRIPDVNVRDLPSTAGFSMVAGDFLEMYGGDRGEWDVVATCFFIDTANNILHYLDVISRMLKVGGIWVNFGPLLYHFSEMDRELSIELTWEELRATFANYGFRIEKEEAGLRSTYTAHPAAMLKQEYSNVFCVCVKERDVDLEAAFQQQQKQKQKQQPQPKAAGAGAAPKAAASAPSSPPAPGSYAAAAAAAAAGGAGAGGSSAPRATAPASGRSVPMTDAP